MNSNNKVACPMDCFDTCQAEIREGSVKGSKEHFTTNGRLCVNFAHLLNEDRLEQPRFEEKDISLAESLDILKDKLSNAEPNKVLYYKGSGNLGVMQNSPKNFFSQYGATFTKGSLCEGAGVEGLEQGRGNCVNPSTQNLIDADVVVVWGRNLTVTSPHMYDLIKDKTFITIDPIETKIAKKSEVFLQLNPKTDHELALLMTRFAYMDDMEDEENFKEFASGDDWFFDLAKSRPLVSYESTTGVNLSDVTKAIDLMKNKRVAFLMGLGVQKYYEGAQIMRAIDSFATFIGTHNKDAGGVWYLGDSAYGYDKLISSTPKKSVDLISVDFASYDLVFIQGANPVVSAPNTQRLIEGLKNSFVVYFGTTINDTCEYANLVIPSTNFLAKKDVRLSYGHDLKAVSNVVETKAVNTISEYELTSFLNKEFSFKALKGEDEIIDYYASFDPSLDRKIDSFEFIEELDISPLYENKNEDNYYFITAKQVNTLNSQFKVDNCVHLHSQNGFNNGDEVKISSEFGEAKFIVKVNDIVKPNCLLIYAGAKNCNYLTPPTSDEVAFSAIFQEVLVNIELS